MAENLWTGELAVNSPIPNFNKSGKIKKTVVVSQLDETPQPQKYNSRGAELGMHG